MYVHEFIDEIFSDLFLLNPITHTPHYDPEVKRDT
jgi:hypothetical protein